ncbi:MAG: 3-methyl-2-oxobutanoate hydroxymethyltransferase [Elusimicrobia bacterium RIFCSPLOWO2_12_FULL_59_9]|nr:MAG: 3-methyl-2-oxobutanoate hydroxymethyltransferase [Elusimicrobia bacterium RIFCSPLOWO2_12_FULL_59_9]
MEKITVSKLLQMKHKGEKIAMLTAYDCRTARLLEEAEVEIILIAASLGASVLGYENSVRVTVQDILHHAQAVARGASKALAVADMPFLSCEIDRKTAVRNAGLLIKEGGAQAVKVEGGLAAASIIKELVKAGIPVMGHVGLTPGALRRFGAYKLQGATEEEAGKILTEAKILEGSGVFAMILECIPSDLAREITRKISVPTIGIGAGPHCDGQSLDIDDLLGLGDEPKPKFVKQYANLRPQMAAAVRAFRHDVREGLFPAPEQEYNVKKAAA